MAAGNSGDIQMNGNVDWNAIAKQTLRYQYCFVCIFFRFLSILRQWPHGWEQQNVPNGSTVGQQHYQTV